MSDSHTRIYLTGFMGSGKSTVGPHVARLLGYRFVDLDRQIENETGLPVAAFFRLKGEPAFRKVEREALERLMREDRVVVSLGGGGVAQDDLRLRLLETGTLVCLSVPFDVLVERLSRNPAKRPMLHGAGSTPLGGDELVQRIRALLAARADAYAQAHVMVDGDSPSPEDTARRVVAAVQSRPDAA